jgi:hypothetical protein
MLITWLITAATLLVAVVVIAIVALGNSSASEKPHGELTQVMAEASKHLNGEAEPPKPLVELFGAIPDPRPSARSADSASAFTPRPTKEAVR